MFQKGFILFLLGLTACHPKQDPNIEGTWNFSKITNIEGEITKPSSLSDEMNLSNGTFQYAIDTLKLEAAGTYSFSEDSLSYHYKLPSDTLRKYFVKELSSKHLILQEGNTLFQFQR